MFEACEVRQDLCAQIHRPDEVQPLSSGLGRPVLGASSHRHRHRPLDELCGALDDGGLRVEACAAKAVEGDESASEPKDVGHFAEEL